MVIKITVRDNDYSEYLEKFMKSLWTNITYDIERELKQQEKWVKNPDDYMNHLLESFDNIENKEERLVAIKESKSIEDIKNDMYANMSKVYHLDKDINNILNPNLDHKLTDEDKELLIDRIRKAIEPWFYDHLERGEYFPDVNRVVPMLMEDLEIKILKSFTDKWENGENVYWFQHSGAIINQ